MKQEPAPITPVMLTVDQACTVGGVGRTQLYKFINAGLIRTVKIGTKGVRVPTSEMHALPQRLLERGEAAA